MCEAHYKMNPLCGASLVWDIYLKGNVAKVNDRTDELIKNAANGECLL